MGKLLARLLGVEHPFDPSSGVVAFLHPGGDFRDQFLAAADSPVHTLTAKNADLELAHIQPARVLGRVMDLQPLQYAMGFWRWKRLIQRAWAMGGQIVHHHTDHVRTRIMDIDQVTHASGKVHRSALLRDLHGTPWPMDIQEHEQVHGAVATILVIVTPGLPRGRRDWLPHLANQLGWALVKADHRPFAIWFLCIKI